MESSHTWKCQICPFECSQQGPAPPIAGSHPQGPYMQVCKPRRAFLLFFVIHLDVLQPGTYGTPAANGPPKQQYQHG